MKPESKSAAARRRSHAESTILPSRQSIALPDDFSRRVTRRLSRPLHEALAASAGSKERAADIMDLVRHALDVEIERVASRGQVAPLPPSGSSRDWLPTDDLSTQDVLDGGLVALSQASLYRAVRDGRFYCIRPAGRTNGRRFPAWQFIRPAPELLPALIAELSRQPSTSIHAFWVSERSEFNGLSPAELLVGLPFETRGSLRPGQVRLLALPVDERAARVRSAILQEGDTDFVG